MLRQQSRNCWCGLLRAHIAWGLSGRQLLRYPIRLCHCSPQPMMVQSPLSNCSCFMWSYIFKLFCPNVWMSLTDVLYTLLMWYQSNINWWRQKAIRDNVIWSWVGGNKYPLMLELDGEQCLTKKFALIPFLLPTCSMSDNFQTFSSSRKMFLLITFARLLEWNLWEFRDQLTSFKRWSEICHYQHFSIMSCIFF